MRPREAEHLSGDGGSAGGAGDYGKRGHIWAASAGVGDVGVWGIYAGTEKLWWGVFACGGFYPRWELSVKIWKESNNPQLSYGNLTNSTWPPSASYFGFLRRAYLDHSICCGTPLTTHLDWHWRYDIKQKFEKTLPGGRTLLPVLMLMPHIFPEPSYLLSCKIWAKSDNWSPSYGNLSSSRWLLSATLAPSWIFEEGIHAHCETPFSTQRPNLAKMSWSAPEICPQTGIQKMPLGSEILLSFPMSTLTVLQWPSYASLWQTSAKSDYRWLRYSDLTILPFGAPFGVPFVPMDLRVGDLPPPQLVP